MDDYPYKPLPAPEKAEWPRGIWDDEPDRASWTDEETGFQCAVIRHRMGSLCGYVRLPDDHPLFAKRYDDIVPVPAGWLDRSFRVGEDLSPIDLLCGVQSVDWEDCSAPVGLLFFCHGGLTFSERGWIGFDCAHAGDFVSGLVAFGRREGTYRDFGYVRQQCECLARQACDYAAAWSPR